MLNDKGLEGPIPPTAWALPATLEELHLSNNLLIGSLPAEWGLLNSLRRLDLQNNMLTGTIPEGWSLLGSLDQIQLQSNFLTGSACSPVVEQLPAPLLL